MSEAVRLHIIGGPGSGKTTLARMLSSRLHSPWYDLDLLGQKNGTDPVAHVTDAFKIAAQAAWITEGIYVVTTEPLLAAADQIVLLDVSWPVAAWRIIKRHAQLTLRGTNPYPGLGGLYSFLGYARNFYTNRANQHEQQMRLCLMRQSTIAMTPDAMVSFLEEFHEVSIPPTIAFARNYLTLHGAKVSIIRTADERARLLQRLTGSR